MPSLNDLHSYLISDVLVEFHGIGKQLARLDRWEEYMDLWFDALQAAIQDADDRFYKAINHP